MQPQEGERRACCEDPLRPLPIPSLQLQPLSSTSTRALGHLGHARVQSTACKFTDNFRLHLLCPSSPKLHLNFSLLTSQVCVGGGGEVNIYTYLLSHQTVPRITCKNAPKRLNEVPDTLSLFSRSAMSDSFATPWTGSFLSIGFPRQEYWSELPFPPPGDLPNPGMEPESLCLLHRRWLLYR